VATLLREPRIQASLDTILARLEQRDLPAEAQRLATYILGGEAGEVREPALESTCRWAALRGHWSMLSHSARQSSFQQTMPRMSAVTNRLLAEGLIQSGHLDVA